MEGSVPLARPLSPLVDFPLRFRQSCDRCYVDYVDYFARDSWVRAGEKRKSDTFAQCWHPLSTGFLLSWGLINEKAASFPQANLRNCPVGRDCELTDGSVRIRSRRKFSVLWNWGVVVGK
jgi:hypothetical protein